MADTPYIDYTSPLGGTVPLHHTVELKCGTPDSTIYYTTDGSKPHPWNKLAQVYDDGTGVVLNRPGFVFVRACAVAEEMIYSNIFTSKRFSVSEHEDLTTTTSESSESEEETSAVSYSLTL